MKIDYNILWFEDNKNSVNGYVMQLKNFLKTKGFRLHVKWIEEANDKIINKIASEISVYNQYDLILCDYNLTRGKSSDDLKDGDIVARDIRARLAVDMVLYSSDGVDVLRRALFDESVDAVYIINRNEFNEDLHELIERQIMRNFDMNNMRGVLLSEIAEIESTMRERLQSSINKLPSEGLIEVKELYLKAKKSSLDKLDEHVKDVDSGKVNETEIFDDVVKTNFDLVRTTLKKISDDPALTELLKDDALVHSFQQHRNIMAHYKSSVDNRTGKMHFADKNKYYSLGQFEDLRKDALKIVESLRI